MRIRVGTLRRLIREHGLSPAIFNGQPVQDPMQKPNITKALQALDNAFKQGVSLNLVLSHADKYNKETREFDDATYNQLMQAADAASEKLSSVVGNAVKQAWADAHQSGGSGEAGKANPKAA